MNTKTNELLTSKRTTMKSIIITLFFPLLWMAPCIVKAQSLSAGLAGGLSMGAVEIEDIDDEFESGIEGESVFGYEAGIFARLGLGPLYVRPQLMYRFQSGQVSYQVSTEGERKQVFRAHRIQVPLMFGLHLVGPLAIEAGPAYNYLFSVTEDYGDNDINISRNSIGYRVGPALNFDNWMFFANYEGMFNSGGADGADGADFREPYRIIFGLGIALGDDASDDDDDDNDDD